MTDAESIVAAAGAIARANALVVTAGAGMGVDSGLPDFRGNEGFWRAYPPYEHLGLRFEDLATPHWFDVQPDLAWGFYGHRLELYRRTTPHPGFARLRAWGETMEHGSFVFTSNVDSGFQRAGFDPLRLVECHGSLDQLQCVAACGAGLFPSDAVRVDVDSVTFRAREPWPRCPACNAVARPNALLFNDDRWDESRTSAQQERMARWLDVLPRGVERRLVVIECGAGTAVPSVRRFSESLVRMRNATLVRINPREPQVPRGQIAIAMGARDAIDAIEVARVSLGGIPDADRGAR